MYAEAEPSGESVLKLMNVTLESHYGCSQRLNEDCTNAVSRTSVQPVSVACALTLTTKRARPSVKREGRDGIRCEEHGGNRYTRSTRARNWIVEGPYVQTPAVAFSQQRSLGVRRLMKGD